ncbi:MAG: PadR family transcriptional regulator [Sphingobacteriales bacterium]|nr:MAG: PadR family transcriptional regulator [Sphingobacteriales bacterium]
MYLEAMQQDSANFKELLKGTTGPIILRLLHEYGKMYGYEISQKVKDLSDGRILVKEGSLYPALHKLEADGLIVAEEVFVGKRVRRYYKLTTPGKKAARASVDELVDFLRTIYGLITAEPLRPHAAS